jgi:hypothetical protein
MLEKFISIQDMIAIAIVIGALIKIIQFKKKW